LSSTSQDFTNIQGSEYWIAGKWSISTKYALNDGR
jgi:hypothetical protein